MTVKMTVDDDDDESGDSFSCALNALGACRSIAVQPKDILNGVEGAQRLT